MDYNKYLIDQSKELAEKSVPNLKLEVGDWFDMPARLRGTLDGILNVHTFCCFKHVDSAIDALVALEPRWIAFNSLFSDGDFDVLIHIRDHKRYFYETDDNPDGDFNTFSLPYVKKYLNDRGYKKFFSQPFDIPVSLPKPKTGGRGTYTVATEMSPRTQFSGSVYLPWHLVLAMR